MLESRSSPRRYFRLEVIVLIAVVSLWSCERQNLPSGKISQRLSFAEKSTAKVNAQESQGIVRQRADECNKHHGRLVPIFEIRSPVGVVQPLQPNNCLFERPKRIAFAGYTLFQKDNNIVRSPKRGSVGFVEFDAKSRVVARGIWEGGRITTTKFAYAASDYPFGFSIFRDGQPLGEGVVMEYIELSDMVAIRFLLADSGLLVGKEIQEFDHWGRLVLNRVCRNRSCIRYTFHYGNTCLPTEIVRFDEKPTTDGDVTVQPRESWKYTYDKAGRVTEFASTSLLGAESIEQSNSFAYDKNGNIVRATYGEGSDARSTRFEYEFDEKENWVNRVELPVGGLKNGNDTGYEIERTITYWD